VILTLLVFLTRRRHPFQYERLRARLGGFLKAHPQQFRPRNAKSIPENIELADVPTIQVVKP
jgi:hypothetical protein